MRDAFGGTMMITILMVFIVIFVSFTAVIVNVAKTFRIKNAVINYVEQYDYKNNQSSAETQIESYLRNAGYNLNLSSPLDGCDVRSGARWYSQGLCVAPSESGDYYKVTVYVSISLPFFDINMTIPVSGESKSVQTLS